MKKLAILITIVALMLTACSNVDDKNLLINATVADIFENSLSVTVADNQNFDNANVSITDKTIFEGITFKNIKKGDKLEIEILPLIEESYPVGVTAVKIKTLITEEEKPVYHKISPEQAKEIMDSGENIVILDVRTPEEFAEGHIENAILIPDYEINTAETKIPNKGEKILVYCRSGRRSENAAKTLVSLGYSQVYDFGGIIDWEYEIVK